MFPRRPRAQIGSTDTGLDADHRDHASDDVPRPDLEVTGPEVVGVLWSPDGVSYREVLDREPIEFGFQPRCKR